MALAEQRQIVADEAPELYPGLGDTAGMARLDRELALADLETGTFLTGSALRDKAVALMACHVLTLRRRNEGATAGSSGAGGAITSEKEGDLERSHGSTDVGEAAGPFASTSFGLELLRLRAGQVLTPMTRINEADMDVLAAFDASLSRSGW